MDTKCWILFLLLCKMSSHPLDVFLYVCSCADKSSLVGIMISTCLYLIENYVKCYMSVTNIIHNTETLVCKCVTWTYIMTLFTLGLIQRFYFFSFAFLSQITFKKLIHNIIFAVSDDWSLWMFAVCQLLWVIQWIMLDLSFKQKFKASWKNFYHRVRVSHRSRLWMSNFFKLYKMVFWKLSANWLNLFLFVFIYLHSGFWSEFRKMPSFTKIQLD